MQAKEQIKMKGRVELSFIRDGKVFKRLDFPNLVVNGGVDAMRELLAVATPGKVVNNFSVGTNGTAPSSADTAITGAFNKSVDGHTTPSTGVVKFKISLSTAQANGIMIAEAGLFCADATLFARTTNFTPFLKDNTFAVTGIWTITF
jgi:hypothetical protein